MQNIPEVQKVSPSEQFTSNEFKSFTKEWNINHANVSPHYQQSNEMAERAIQTIKKLIIKTTQILVSKHLRGNLPINNQLLKPKLIDSKLYTIRKSMIHRKNINNNIIKR